MAIDPKAVGATTEPQLFEWTDRDTLLYAIGVGAGLDELAFTTENSHDIPQQVLPTYAVICCPAFAAAGKVGSFNWAMLLHGSQTVRLHAPLPPAGKLSVATEVVDIQDKGEGKNAVLMLRGVGTDPDTGTVVAETLTNLVIRGEGGFGGEKGERAAAPEFPDREPDTRVDLPTREDQALIYRLSGDRNPCTATPGSPPTWPASPGRSCTACAPTAWRAAPWSPSWATASPPTSPRSPPGSPSRCSPARHCPPRSGRPSRARPCFAPKPRVPKVWARAWCSTTVRWSTAISSTRSGPRIGSSARRPRRAPPRR